MKHTLLAAVLLVPGASALAAADTYLIDGGHTFANFEYDHFGFSRPSAKFDTTTGTVTLDLAAKTGSVDVTIDAASVNSGVAKLDDHLKGPDFFDVAKFPTITYKSRALKFDGDKLAAIDGDLTVHGVTRPVTLAVTHFACKEHPMKKIQACGAGAETTVKRSDFGLAMYTPGVSDEVKIRISIEATKKPAP